MATDYYKILGVAPTASDEEIKEAYKRLAMRFHPDRNTSAGAEEKFKEIGQAYQILSDTKQREAFDRSSGRQNYSQTSASRSGHPYQPFHHTRPQPINTNHIHFVFRTINRNEEKQSYSFGEHEYDNSSFNRYMFNRTWDPEGRRWIYTKRKNTTEYTAAMQRRSKIMNFCVTVILLGSAVGIINYRLNPLFTNKRTHIRDESHDELFYNRARVELDERSPK